MFVLRHVSRNAARRPFLQYISTTSIRGDETGTKDPSLSNDQKPSKKDQKTDHASNKLSASQLEARKTLQDFLNKSEGGTVLQNEAEVEGEVKQVDNRHSEQREKLKSLFNETEIPKEEATFQEEVGTHENVRNFNERQLAKKNLQNLFRTPEKVIEVSDILEDDAAVEKTEEERLKGKQKLEELMRQAKTFKVTDKVELSHPGEKRPVDKVLPKADSKAHIDLLKSIRDVATEIGGNVIRTEKELMQAVFEKRASEENEKKRIAEPTASIGDVVSDMAVDVTKAGPRDRLRTLFDAQEQMQHQRVRYSQTEDGSYEPRESQEVFNLYDSSPLGIFDEKYREEVSTKSRDQVVLETYNAIEKKELKRLITHSPRNIYEEMIKWTEEGKLWHFPIDNEWKWDWEEKVEFTEHILLEQHLEPWCPTGGPIRHFMELVCVGLGKNPYITAEEKRQHIYWFRDYFEEKRKLLEEIGAFGSEQKKIEQAQESS